MSRHVATLVALALVALAGLMLSIGAWVMLWRDRRAARRRRGI